MNASLATAARFPRLSLVLSGSFLLLFASCEQSDHLFILNPDGSGRVTAKEQIRISHLDIKGKDALAKLGIPTLAEFVLNSKGIDVWEQVSYKLTKSGALEIQLTGLFADIAKVDLPGSAAPNRHLAAGVKFEKGDATRPASIELQSPISGVPQLKKTDDPLTPGEIDAELTKTREVWGESEKNFRFEMRGKRAKVTFHLPGAITSQSNFKKDARNQVSLEITSGMMIDTLTKLIADDDIAKGILKGGTKILANEAFPPINAQTFNQLSFGEAKPIRVEFAPAGAVFDYNAAVEKAKANPSEMVKKVVVLAELHRN